MPDETIQGVASDTDALCLDDAERWFGWWKTREAIAESGRVLDLEGCPYHAVWLHSRESCRIYCQICGIRLEDANGSLN
jgi:hypothetical protein